MRLVAHPSIVAGEYRSLARRWRWRCMRWPTHPARTWSKWFSIIDARSGHLLKSVDPQRHPNSLTLNPKTGEVYVMIKNARDAARGSNESVARIKY
jgi:hypothetical protein